jgi:predicted nucleic acid-binding protein
LGGNSTHSKCRRTQVSAYISEETKAEVEAYVKRHGVKKAYLIEEALQHHLQALREIPEDVIIPSRLILTPEAMIKVAGRLDREEQPTDALKALFRD